LETGKPRKQQVSLELKNVSGMFNSTRVARRKRKEVHAGPDEREEGGRKGHVVQDSRVLKKPKHDRVENRLESKTEKADGKQEVTSLKTWMRSWKFRLN
jgi:hypothetical protein